MNEEVLTALDDTMGHGSVQGDEIPLPADPPDDDSIDVGCPGGGNVSGGICTPYSNKYRSTWMSTYMGCQYLRVADSILPGTHNSGFDKEAPYTNSYETCQDVSPYKQWMTGIRVLDLRVQFFFGYQAGDPKRFQIFHSLSSGRTIEGDVLSELLRFRQHVAETGDPKKEVIILDFHEFKGFNPEVHRELAAIIKARLGPIIIEPWMSNLTINQIWEYGDFGVVIAYNADPRDRRFWRGVNQRWIGENSPSTDKLKTFMNTVAAETKPHDELRSIQCAKYTLVLQPDDFSDKIRQWFYSKDQRSYIQGFFVINTDWSLRQRLIDNCIHGCNQKLERLFPYTVFNVSPALETTLPAGYRSVVAKLSSVFQGGRIHLPKVDVNHATVLITSSASQACDIITGNTDYPADIMRFNNGDIVAFTYDVVLGKWLIQAHTYSPGTDRSNIPTPKAYEKLIHFKMENGDWQEQLSLPATAPDNSVVHLTSKASQTATLSGNHLEDGISISIPLGFSGAFMFHSASGEWAWLDKAPDPGFLPPDGFHLGHNNYYPVELYWNAAPRAAKYRVYHYFQMINETTGTSFVKQSEGAGRYHVRAVSNTGEVSGPTPYVWFYPPARMAVEEGVRQGAWQRLMAWLRRRV